MARPDSVSPIPPAIAAWLDRQAPDVRGALLAAVDFSADRVRDPRLGEPASDAVACLRQLAELDVRLPSDDYFRTAFDLLDKAGTTAFQLGARHCRTDNELRMFLSLAGTALFGEPAAIARFEDGFSPDARFDDAVLYLQAELDMLDGGFPGE